MEERQMEVTINYNGQAVAVEVTLEVYEFLDRADHKTENLFHEQRRHWDGREFDEYIITTEGVGAYGETPEEYLCHMETLHELRRIEENKKDGINRGRTDYSGKWLWCISQRVRKNGSFEICKENGKYGKVGTFF